MCPFLVLGFCVSLAVLFLPLNGFWRVPRGGQLTPEPVTLAVFGIAKGTVHKGGIVLVCGLPSQAFIFTLLLSRYKTNVECSITLFSSLFSSWHASSLFVYLCVSISFLVCSLSTLLSVFSLLPLLSLSSFFTCPSSSSFSLFSPSGHVILSLSLSLLRACLYVLRVTKTKASVAPPALPQVPRPQDGWLVFWEIKFIQGKNDKPFGYTWTAVNSSWNVLHLQLQKHTIM